MEKDTIHIACNIDTSYVKYCIVMLTSLFENNREVRFHIHVIAGELSEDARKQLCDWVEKRYLQRLTIYEAGKDLLQGCMIMVTAIFHWLLIIGFSGNHSTTGFAESHISRL